LRSHPCFLLSVDASASIDKKDACMCGVRVSMQPKDTKEEMFCQKHSARFF